ncbi:YidH family protein [Corynebacterium aquatimens]|uniref:Membrane protein n=1 Tax=Corynebacterium aquatimens TaxID=1190508 RepID=A0A931E118_9CORY|nr:DUF202 domain-containing protein [Corynebacterium aquatimens]MBG6122749.1 putative membrane protein [Corynebacterium aquatimens]WJY66914.1 Inner membrane protein YidH [Corynebacterium aquatimens]
MNERDWFTRTVLPDGEEPDPRFTLANERTFLAWTRTSLAFLAGGIALEAFALPGLDPDVRRLVAVMIIAVGMAIAGGASVRWVRTERALRNGRPLPAPAIAPILGLGIMIACVVVIAGLF